MSHTKKDDAMTQQQEIRQQRLTLVLESGLVVETSLTQALDSMRLALPIAPSVAPKFAFRKYDVESI
jgi:predicted outer membrane protein